MLNNQCFLQACINPLADLNLHCHILQRDSSSYTNIWKIFTLSFTFWHLFHCHLNAPNFEKVEGAYCFQLVLQSFESFHFSLLQPLQTVWTQIRPDILSGLIWVQTVWQPDGIYEGNIWKSQFWKKFSRQKSMQNYPASKEFKVLPNLIRLLCCPLLAVGSWNFIIEPWHEISNNVVLCARSSGSLLVQACPGKSVVRWTDHPAMTIAVDLGRKATKQTKTNNVVCAPNKASDQPAHTRSLIRAFAIRLNILWFLSYWPIIIWSF